MAKRDKPHIFVKSPARAEPYRPPPRVFEGKKRPAPDDPLAHGQKLHRELVDAEKKGKLRRERQAIEVEGALGGIYYFFESFPEIQMMLESLEPRRGKTHPELRAVRQIQKGKENVVEATVFVPDGRLGHFLKGLKQYIETSGAEKRSKSKLYDGIATIGLASLEKLWTDLPEEFPRSRELVWWEVWLRRRDGKEDQRFKEFAEGTGLKLVRPILGFTDRMVVLVEATAVQLAAALDILDDLAELRRPQETAALLAFEPPEDQARRVAMLVERTEPASTDSPAVCVVDTGIHYQHSLLSASLDESDCHTCDPRWGILDFHGHGTEMAGLALFGDLGSALISSEIVCLRHRLESVKLLPKPGHKQKQLYGALTATGVSQVEVMRPERPRVFSMAITSELLTSTNPSASTTIVGQPSSWSSAVDALSIGQAIDVNENGLIFLGEADFSASRLFIVSAGNIDVKNADHLTTSDLEPVHDPGQAWNALTVGAFTNLDDMGQTTDYQGWMPVASRGELSPFSRTSVVFDDGWPLKPDVVLEGGNAARSQDGRDFDTPEVLQLLTTRAPLNGQRSLTVTNATSAATAQAGYLGASILADYPSFWPETVRALIVHSAQWTDPMRKWFEGAAKRKELENLQRRYGMGVPDLVRATKSASNSLTLIVQDIIHPFDGKGRMREMHLHNLPWPTDVLADLGEASVRMRVTLSYFIEPNPGRRGWASRYVYSSHGLRFDVRRATESTDDFRKRINKLARDENGGRVSSESDSKEWFFGPQKREKGSLHTDIWEGAAADLAERGVVAIYPVTGWWKGRKDRDRSERGARYSLVVSIEAPEVDVDIYTPVAEEVGVPIETEI